MKRKLRILIIAGLLALASVFFVACGTPALPAPTDLAIENKTVTWSGVENARSYSVEIAGVVHDNIRRTSYSFDSMALAEGTYTIKVRAHGNGIEYSDSPWAQIKYVQGYESGMRYTLINDGAEYAVSSVGRAQGDIVIEDMHNGLPVTAISRLAFSNSLTVTSVTLGKNIKTVEERAFYGCTEMKSLKLNDGLEFIGDEAFQSCRSIDVIDIPNSVKSLGVRAFAYCRGATEVYLGRGLLSIDDSAFDTCIALKAVTIPKNIKILGESVFRTCESIEKVVFEGDELFVGKSTFESCKSLKSVDLGNATFAISVSMFSNCTSLETIVIPDAIPSIGTNAFSGCSALKNVTIGDGVTSIGGSAFFDTAIWNDAEGCIVVVDKWFVGSKTYAVLLPDGSTAVMYAGDIEMNSYRDADIVGIADYAFNKNGDDANETIAVFDAFNQVRLPLSLKYIGQRAFFLAMLNAVEVPNNVTKIGSYAFASCERLRTVVLGSKVEEIDNYAFANSVNLAVEGINIPNSVKRIGTYAFYKTSAWDTQVVNGDGLLYVGNWFLGCSPLVSGDITLRPGTTAIADYAFSYCTLLKSVTIPDSVTNIGEGAFYGCGGAPISEWFPDWKYPFTTNIPYGVDTIKPYTFYGSGLSSIIIPNSVHTIGYAAFSNTSGLTVSLVVPDSVEVIEDYAFFRSGITAITLSKNITDIPSSAFSGTNIRTIKIPDRVTSIGDYAFFRCEALSTVEFNGQLTSIGDYAFYMCGLNALELPSSVTDIGDFAFYKCLGLTEIGLGDNLLTIGEYAFYGCNMIEHISLPESVTSIGDSAFRYCTRLKDILLGRYVAYIGSYAFYGCNTIVDEMLPNIKNFSAVTLYCEASSKPDGWGWRWNSTYRPVVYGCTFSAGNEYVVSVVKGAGSIENANAYGGISAPKRKGYTFVGWATSPNGAVEYDANGIVNAPDGTTLYSVWKEGEEEPAPPPEYEFPTEPIQ